MSEAARSGGEATAQPTLVSGDVTLRPWRLGDESTIGLSRDSPVLSRMQEAIRRWHQGYADARSIVSYLVVRTSDPVPLGTCQVRDSGDDVGEVTWTTYAPYRRKGYATDALLTLCRYAFDELGMVRLETYLAVDDRPSQRVAARSGFVREGLLRGKRSDGDRRRDLLLYARLVSDPVPVLRLPTRRRAR
ncbi:MAG: GNAT family N-acetyltransferase [Streptosporangiales bacterium]|nr:GNAT family N-acetyltransferase [Streptosporangiales bacterium]